MIIGLWLISFLLGFSNYFSGIFELSSGDEFSRNFYCTLITYNRYNEAYCTYVIALLCFFTMTYVYLRIWFIVRKKQEVHVQLSPLSNLEKQHRKATLTTLLILGTFVLLWLPAVVGGVVDTSVNSVQTFKLLLHLSNLLIVNAISDPIIYGVRLTTIRSGYKRLWEYLTCHC